MTVAMITQPLTVPDLLGTSPADLLPSNSERHDSTPTEARERAERLRAGIVRYAEMRQDIADAFACRDWIALGYESWYAYVEGEFGEQLARLDRGERREAVGDLRAQGMSTRQIASATGIGQTQVVRDLKQVNTNGSPETVTGSDGKSYASSRPAPKPTQTPGPVESLSTALPGPGPSPAPASAAPGPTQEPAAEPERHLRAVPDPAPVTPPPGSPATWGPAEHEQHRLEVERKAAIAACERVAASLVMEIQGMVTTIIDGLDSGAPGIPVGLADIDECRAALDRLEARVMSA